MTVYNEALAKKCAYKSINGIIAASVSAVLTIAACVSACLFAFKDESLYSLYQVILTAIITVGGWTSITFIVVVTVPSQKEKRFVSRMISGEKRTVKGVFSGYGKAVTYCGHKAKEFVVDTGEDKRVLFIRESAKVSGLAAGDEITVVTVDNFVFDTGGKDEK